MSRISSIVTASEPNRIVEMNRRARFHAELTRPRAPAAGASVTSTSTLAGASTTTPSDRVATGTERIVDVDIADPYLRYQPAKAVRFTRLIKHYCIRHKLG